MKISIIVASRNCATTIQRCIDSVAGQGHLEKELIIMDGCSTDGTREIIERNDTQVAYWESKPDRGVYHAWNKALEKTSGEWVCFLGADDYLWDNEVLKCFAPILAEAHATGHRFVYGKIVLQHPHTDDTQCIVGKPWQEARKGFLRCMTVPHCGSFHHKELFKEHGLFDESFKIAGDYDFLLRELKDRQAVFVDRIITGMQIGGLSSSVENQLISAWETLRALRNNDIGGVPLTVYLWIFRIKVFMIVKRLLGESLSNRILNIYGKITNSPKI